ncbi:MAG: DNA topoisomerase (ATP-hydrolyzing) subunit A [Acutalibacteraceae bacterium]|nr:DNA topoisomerase (ATP-hydrolyzing) subunit A [Acutalibacteraceae bacterium]
MAPRKKKETEAAPKKKGSNAFIAGAGTVIDQEVTETLKSNFMPYAMSIIVSRAIPEIDGFKPSHRKLLYTMYNMGLLNGSTIKSANIVGRTMQLNPHGDGAIYETMVRLSEGYEALLHPFVASKGSFGKAYSRDMAYAASRYTEAKLAPISAELFADIDKDTVDFVDNYDATMKEPVLFPVTFPTILVNSNMGIAAGMASNICSFNLKEVCETTIAYIKDNDINVADTLLAPDFPIGGELLYNREEIEKIYETGRGSFKVRGVYTFDKKNNCIDITEIPPTSTSEAIIEKVIELVKLKKITEINDIRDETDLSGLKITIDLKRGADPDKLMKKLYRLTPLQDSFACNFNILIAGYPKVMGIKEIISEWVAYRTLCVKRRVYHSLTKAKDKLHLLKGLSKILLDIDKAIKIVRETAEEKEVVPNLMIGFGIDEIQAEYVAEIKLRHLNREYILKRLDDIEKLESEIDEMESILKSNAKILKIIVGELTEVIKKYGSDRKTKIVSFDEAGLDSLEEKEVDNSPVTFFFTNDGYFKKITPLSLRMSGEQKCKEGDFITQTVESTNAAELLFFTNKQQVYKTTAEEFAETKASVLGDYIPAKLDFDEGEFPVYMTVVDKYTGYMLFVYENGRISKVALSSYETKTNRKKLIKAYCEKYPLFKAIYIKEETELMLRSTNGRVLLVNSANVPAKGVKDNGGIAVMTQKRGQKIEAAEIYVKGSIENEHRLRTRTLPAAGNKPVGSGSQDEMSFE